MLDARQREQMLADAAWFRAQAQECQTRWYRMVIAGEGRSPLADAELELRDDYRNQASQLEQEAQQAR